jgi:hypothetical protein
VKWQCKPSSSARKKTALLDQADGAEGAKEEDALNCGEDEAFAEGAGGGVAPMESPGGFSTNAWECPDSPEEPCLFGHVWDQRFDQ